VPQAAPPQGQPLIVPQAAPQTVPLIPKIALWSLSVICAIMIFFVQNYSQLKNLKEDLAASLPIQIERSTIFTKASTNYIERKDLETKVNIAFDSSGLYYIVYGAKGVGKSEVVDHCGVNRSGVIKLMVTSANSKDDIVSLLSKKLLGINDLQLDLDMLQIALMKSNVTATVIFDVERGGSIEQALGIQAVRSFAKFLTPFCRSIIVLSEANAVLNFGQDSSREKIIYVDELTHSEARKFLLENGFKMGEKEMQYIIDNIGSNAAMLLKLSLEVSDTETLKLFVDDVLAIAEQDLVSFPHKAILKALKEHPHGVAPKYFNNQEHKGVDLSNPQAVGASMKGSNAIVYRIELRLFTLMSTAHRTAIKSYDPIL
jgi:hypothetical protein